MNNDVFKFVGGVAGLLFNHKADTTLAGAVRHRTRIPKLPLRPGGPIQNKGGNVPALSGLSTTHPSPPVPYGTGWGCVSPPGLKTNSLRLVYKQQVAGT